MCVTARHTRPVSLEVQRLRSSRSSQRIGWTESGGPNAPGVEGGGTRGQRMVSGFDEGGQKGVDERIFFFLSQKRAVFRRLTVPVDGAPQERSLNVRSDDFLFLFFYMYPSFSFYFFHSTSRNKQVNKNTNVGRCG